MLADRCAVEELVALGDPTALIDRMRNEAGGRDRWAAAVALGRLGHATPAVLDALVDRLRDDKDDLVRRAAAEALGQLPGKWVPVLTALLEQLGRHAEVAVALGRLARAFPEVVRLLLARLQDPDYDPVSVVEALGASHQATPDVINALTALLDELPGDTDARLEEAITTALGDLEPAPTPEVINALIARFRISGRVYAADDALCLLGQATLDPVIEALLERLRDPDPAVREMVAKQLAHRRWPGQSTPPAVIDALLERLHDPNEQVRYEAIYALCAPCKFHRIDALGGVLRNLSHVENRSLYEAIQKAIRRDGRRTPSALVDAKLQLPYAFLKNAHVRQSITKALAEPGPVVPSRIVDALLDRLVHDPKDLIRGFLAESLAELGQEGRLGAAGPTVLAELLRCHEEDPEPYVRARAALAMGLFGQASPEIIAVLLKDLRHEAPRPLGRLANATPAMLEGLAERLRDDQHADVRASAAEALAKVGPLDAATLEQLRVAFFDEDDNVSETAVRALAAHGIDVDPRLFRREAAEALGRLGQATPAVLGGLAERLRDDEQAVVRAAAAKALAEMGPIKDPAILELLVRCLQDEDEDLRLAAIRALAAQGAATSDVLEALLECLHDSEHDVREAAARALEDLGQSPPPVLVALLELLKDEQEEWVRWAAASGLGHLAQWDSAIFDWLRQALVVESEPTSAFLLKFALAQAQAPVMPWVNEPVGP